MTQRLLDILVSSFPRLVLYCVQVTIPLTVCIYILSLVLGFLLALIQIQKIPVLKPLARVYVWVFRGTPLIVQMYIIFFGLPSLGITLDAFPSAVIAFSLNYAAYMSEAIRAAIQSVPEGQWEAGYMIGLSSGQIMLRVILPQAARVAFPTLFSTLIGLTKDSSLAASITVVEMFKAAQQIASRTFEPFALYCEAAAQALRDVLAASGIEAAIARTDTGWQVTLVHAADGQKAEALLAANCGTIPYEITAEGTAP